MIQIAQDRILHLFSLAEVEARRGPGPWPDRYVQLARRIGTRYNVRVPHELGERYCRGCSAFWVEGRTVRTRLRAGRRARTCLVCGRTQRLRWGDPRSVSGGPPPGMPADGVPPGMAAAEVSFERDEDDEDGSDSE